MPRFVLFLTICRGLKPPFVVAADLCGKDSVCNSTAQCTPAGKMEEKCMLTGESSHMLQNFFIKNQEIF